MLPAYLCAQKSTAPDMVLVEGGTFPMGSNNGDDSEKPVHSVTVHSFLISAHEVTQKEWREVMGSSPSHFKGDTLPVEQVSWFDAVNYCNKRSVKEGLQPCFIVNATTVTCNFRKSGYRLPTEAEWEFAARGGKDSRGYGYAGSDDLQAVAWFEDNSGETTHAVGTKAANELGLYDMTGNVWEWCWDWFMWYTAETQADPTGPGSGLSHVLRGGGWVDNSDYCRVSFRNTGVAKDSVPYYGVRIARSAP
jgi:formylglycine-generating enzyme required for sulfatase activity